VCVFQTRVLGPNTPLWSLGYRGGYNLALSSDPHSDPDANGVPSSEIVNNSEPTSATGSEFPVLREIPSAREAYRTEKGAALVGKSEEVLEEAMRLRALSEVQLVFTSPPFPLNHKKKYGNLKGEEFKAWLRGYAPILRDILAADGSIVLEMGNAWEPGQPVMSTLALEALLEFKRSADLHLCQEFVWHNPAKLPTPAQWVTSSAMGDGRADPGEGFVH
jgi:hypothetical protein